MGVTLQTDQMPRDGQFIAYWVIGEVVFAMTFMWDEGALLAYDTFSDDWIVEHGYGDDDASFLPAADEVWFVQYKP